MGAACRLPCNTRSLGGDCSVDVTGAEPPPSPPHGSSPGHRSRQSTVDRCDRLTRQQLSTPRRHANVAEWPITVALVSHGRKEMHR